MNNHPITEEPSPPPAPEWTYWVAPGKLLAGCFPGALEARQCEERLRQLLDAGVRVFVNLMEPDEVNHAGQPFEEYAPDVERLAREQGARARCLRLSIRDLDVPTPEAMEKILDEIDAALEEGAVYLHCWGGVGRTGTVVACWLLRHGRACGTDVLEVLAGLRSMDRHRGHRRSPETGVQLRFVEEWARRLQQPGDAAGRRR